MAKLSGKSLVLLALILSVVTATLVYSYLNKVTNDAIKPGVPVIKAKIDIPPKTTITAEMVQIDSVPPEYIQPGAVTRLEEIVGVTTREQIVAGEQITQRRLVLQGRAIGFSGVIPRDKRAVTVAVTEVTGVAGFVKPGDYVDVLVTFDTNTVGENLSQVFLQNLQVLAVNRDAEPGVVEGNKDKQELKTATVTLAVTPEEASRLTIAEEKGKIRLALRPYMPDTNIMIANVVSPKDLVGIRAVPAQNNSAAHSAPEASPPVKSPPVAAIQVIRGTKVEAMPVQ